MSVAGVGREVNGDMFDVGGVVDDSFDRNKRAFVVQVVHHTHLQLVVGLGLFQVEA